MTHNIVSIFGGHDANITFYNSTTKKYHIIEIERLTGERYFQLKKNSSDYVKDILEQCQRVATKFWGIKNEYDTLLIDARWKMRGIPDVICQVFKTKNVKTISNHHDNHAYCAYYQSPFREALIVSYDGGGDGQSFNFYYVKDDNLKLIESLPYNLGRDYWRSALRIKDIVDNSKTRREYPGKMMGLSAYGKVDEQSKLDVDIAATAQQNLTSVLMRNLKRHISHIPVILTGGCALNVLVNEKIKQKYNNPIFVPPNPHDGGLSLGHMFNFIKPDKRVNVTYSGIPLLDRDKLSDYIIKYDAVKVSKMQIAEKLKEGKIIGFVYGDSEVGPRALGNRSIVCDPSHPDMKDKLNSKVKFREWYRPFAPFCRKEMSHKYFETRDYENLEYMSFAPKVKIDNIPAVTHIDRSARLQTVTGATHKHFYELLTEFGKISKVEVLLNTSFNIKGKPILTKISDAISMLNTTDLDFIIIEDYLFTKNVKLSNN